MNKFILVTDVLRNRKDHPTYGWLSITDSPNHAGAVLLKASGDFRSRSLDGIWVRPTDLEKIAKKLVAVAKTLKQRNKTTKKRRV